MSTRKNQYAAEDDSQYVDLTYGILAGLPLLSDYGNVAGVTVDLGWCGQFARGMWMSSLQSFWGVQIGFVNNGGLVRGLQGGAVKSRSVF